MKKKNQVFTKKLNYESDRAHFRIQNYTAQSLFLDRLFAVPEEYQDHNSKFVFKRTHQLSYPTDNDCITLRELLYETIENKILPYPRYNALVIWNPNAYLAATVSRYRMYRFRVYSHVTIWLGDIDESGIKGLWYIV